MSTITRRDGDGDGLRNVHIFDLDGQVVGSEIAFGLGDVDWTSRGDLGGADFDGLGRRILADGPEQRRCETDEDANPTKDRPITRCYYTFFCSANDGLTEPEQPVRHLFLAGPIEPQAFVPSFN
jgi:hypothetical protein